jgi:poly-beta-1,6-N-acetyl-D-glucosamine synthase
MIRVKTVATAGMVGGAELGPACCRYLSAMTAVPAPTAPATAGQDGLGELRASTAVPLPRLRPIPDFVGMPNGDRPLADESIFWAAQAAALAWLLVCVVVTLLIGGGVASLISWPYAVVLFGLVVWLPAYLSAFRYATLFLEDAPALTVVRPTTPMTVVVSGSTAPASTLATLAHLAAQDYAGPVRVILVGGGLADGDVHAVQRAASELRLDLDIIRAGWLGSAEAWNLALPHVATTLVLALQAGACLHPSAVRLLVAHLESSPPETAAVSGYAFVRNRRCGARAEVIAADYAMEVDATQRIESLYRGARVSEPACMLFQVAALRAVSGLPAGEAGAVTAAWRFLARGWRVDHESRAIAFTTEPVTLGTAGRWRARSERGVISGARESGVNRERPRSSRFVTAVARSGLARDVAFVVAGLHAGALVAWGHGSLVVAYLVLVVPVALAAAALARRDRREVLDEAGLVMPRRIIDPISPMLGLQAVQAPAAIVEALRGWHARRVLSPRRVTRRMLGGRGPRYA